MWRGTGFLRRKLASIVESRGVNSILASSAVLSSKRDSIWDIRASWQSSSQDSNTVLEHFQSSSCHIDGGPVELSATLQFAEAQGL